MFHDSYVAFYVVLLRWWIHRVVVEAENFSLGVLPCVSCVVIVLIICTMSVVGLVILSEAASRSKSAHLLYHSFHVRRASDGCHVLRV